MATTRRFSKEEIAERGEEIYERDVKPTVTDEDDGKFVLIDIESGEFEVDFDEQNAGDRLRERAPDAQIWLRKVGNLHARRIG